MTVLFVCLVVLFAGIWLRRSRLGAALLVASSLAIFVWAWTPFTTAFTGALEWRFLPVAQSPFDTQAIVVLSGRIYPPDESQHEVLPGYGLYRRCHQAALLYKSSHALPIVVTGGPVRT